MLIEEHKEVKQLRDLPHDVMRLRGEIENLRRRLEAET